MFPNPQYDYDLSPDGLLAPLHARNAYPDHPVMISPPLGWVPLVLDLDRRLLSILPNYLIAQVKEKFGELRYYIDSYGVANDDLRVDIARGMILETEIASKRTCQVCGAQGVIRTGTRWHATLCDEHAS